jgi:outer membrane murein-binding lipoprotein Lpp
LVYHGQKYGIWIKPRKFTAETKYVGCHEPGKQGKSGGPAAEFAPIAYKPPATVDPGRLLPLRHFTEEHPLMSCAKKALMVVALTTLFGLWGCTQSAPPNSPSARLRELEAKNARLEDDYKAAVTARDQARKKATALEEQQAQLTLQLEQLQRLAKERDDYRQQAAVRTAERDAFQAQLVQFGRELQNLAQKIDQAAQSHGNPPVTQVPTSTTNTVEGADQNPKS